MKTKRKFFEWKSRMISLPEGSVIVSPVIADRILNPNLIRLLFESSLDHKANGLEDAGDLLLQLSADLQIIRLDHE